LLAAASRACALASIGGDARRDDPTRQIAAQLMLRK